MVCLNGLVLRRDALHSASNARFLLDSMFDFAERLNSLRLSDHEIGLFCAVVVIAPGKCMFLFSLSLSLYTSLPYSIDTYAREAGKHCETLEQTGFLASFAATAPLPGVLHHWIRNLTALISLQQQQQLQQ